MSMCMSPYVVHFNGPQDLVGKVLVLARIDRPIPISAQTIRWRVIGYGEGRIRLKNIVTSRITWEPWDDVSHLIATRRLIVRKTSR